MIIILAQFKWIHPEKASDACDFSLTSDVWAPPKFTKFLQKKYLAADNDS